MPGGLLSLTPTLATGWAAHPRLAEYPVLVHVVHRCVIVRSVLAEAVGAPSARGGFRIDLSPLSLGPADLGRLRFSIGETDEAIEAPAAHAHALVGKLTVEDLIARAHRPRVWVTGATWRDAEAAGLRAETIIDLLYRDYLGRPSDAHGLAHYAQSLRDGALTYDDIRRGFVAADEFHLRRKHADAAPGSIFSQVIVMAASGDDAGKSAPPVPTGQTVVARELARLDGSAFVTELYRRLLRKEPDEGGMAHYLHQLHLGVGKMTVIRTIAGELEAITAGVRVIGYDADEAANPPAGISTTA